MLQQCYIHPEEVMAAYPKILEQLQQMTWMETKGWSYQYQATSIYRGWHMLALPIKHFFTRYIQPTHITVTVLCPDISLHIDIRTSHCYVKNEGPHTSNCYKFTWEELEASDDISTQVNIPINGVDFLFINRWINRWLYSALCIYIAGL